jgi:type VI secretion system secreted protein VgrG
MADHRVTVESTFEVDGTTLRVVAATLRDSLFEIPTLVLEATEGAETPTAEAVIGKDAKLLLARTDGTQDRKFSGLVVEADRILDVNGNFRLRMLIVPKLWKLSRRTDCQMFQEKSVPDIVKEVCEAAGVTDIAFMLGGSYTPRKYVVQYRETDLEFILRLLAEEGIWFCLDFTEADKVIFCDDPAGRGDIVGTTTLKYLHTFGSAESADYVTKLRRTIRVKSDKVTMRDFDFLKPKVKVEGEAEGTDEGTHALEVYAYPGRFTETAVGKRYAKQLTEAIQCERDIVEGDAAVLTLVPGLKFTIEEHPYAKLNAEHLVTGVVFDLRDERWLDAAGGVDTPGQSFTCRFTAIPTAASKYRPPRRSVERTVPGLQTAITRGASGEEIHVDEHGRVKVQFHWDRLSTKDDKSSDWFRTVQLPTGGSMFLPRVGWETSVDFIEGDVDRPLIFQRFYNTQTPPPYALPENKARGSVQTATTPGGGSSNEFRMDDTKGKEEMFFNASKDMSVEVKNNKTETIKNNEKREIGSNATLDVTNSVTHTIGASETIQVGGNQDIHVSTFHVADVKGSHTLTIGGNRDLKIGGDHKHTIKGSTTWTIGGNKMDLVVGAVNEETEATMTHTVGAALVEMTAQGKAIVIGATKTENIGAVKLIVAGANRAVDCGAMLSKMVGGAILAKISGDRNDNAQAAYSEIVAGAQVVKANNVTFEATTMLSLVMGASTITLMPAMVAIAGVSVKLDGAVVDTGIVMDN